MTWPYHLEFPGHQDCQKPLRLFRLPHRDTHAHMHADLFPWENLRRQETVVQAILSERLNNTICAAMHLCAASERIDLPSLTCLSEGWTTWIQQISSHHGARIAVRNVFLPHPKTHRVLQTREIWNSLLQFWWISSSLPCPAHEIWWFALLADT